VRRRDLFSLLAGAAAAWPSIALAQQSTGRKPRIAFLSASSPTALDPRSLEGFRKGLKEQGLVDGETATVEYFWADGKPERLPALAAEVAAMNFDVMVSAGPQALRALKAATSRTQAPIVMAIVSDPVGGGLIDSLPHPGGNLTGLSMQNSDLVGKRLELIKQAVPAIRHVMVLNDPTMGPEGLAETVAAARALGVEALVVDVTDISTVEGHFAAAAGRGVAGLIVMASPFFNFNRRRLIALAAQYRLPAIWETETFVEDGGLLSYGPDFADMYRRSVGYVARILKGAKPADLPVEQPTAFELAVNLNTAQALGLSIPQMILIRADKVIE